MVDAPYWIGIEDKTGEFEFVYSSDKASGGISYTHWNAGQPYKEKGKKSNCVVVKNNGGWDDKKCKEKKRFVCEQIDTSSNPFWDPPIDYLSENMRQYILEKLLHK